MPGIGMIAADRCSSRASQIWETVASIDVLVHNVGIAPSRHDGFLAVTDEMWHAT